MTVVDLRQHILELAEAAADHLPNAGRLPALAAALNRFGDMEMTVFVGLLDKIRIPAPKKPRAPKKTPEQTQAEREAEEKQKLEIDTEKKRIAEQKVEEKKRLAAEKAAENKRIAEQKTEEKKRLAAEKAAAKNQPNPAIIKLGDELNELIQRARHKQATYEEIEISIGKLTSLTKPQLLQVAKLIESDAGLASLPKATILKRIGEVLRRSLGMAERMFM